MFYNTPMRLVTIVTLCTLIAGICAAADPHWIRIQSPNFEIYSTASEGSTRETLRQFEQVRAFFVSTLANRDTKPLPVRIVQFNSDKEYQPYRMNNFAAAYYKAGADLDLIVMGHGGYESYPTAIHEYVHLVVRHAGVRLPPWLNEGLADFYSTLRQVANKVIIGEAIPGRLQEIQREKWVPLSVVLSVDQSSPYYNEKNKAGMFYAESWALTHMLSLDKNYRPKWNEFAKAVMEGKDSTETLMAVYGKPVAAIEQDLQFYVQKQYYSAGSFDAKLEKIDLQRTAEAAPAFDVKLMLVELAAGKTRDETRQAIEALAAEQPSRPEPHEQLGYLLWAGQPFTSEVREQFAKAYALGGRSPRMLWDYGRMLLGNQAEQAVQVLTDLSQREPDRRDVKIEVARAMLNANQPAAAVSTLLELKGCSAEEAVPCMSIATAAYIRLNQRDKALETAQMYLKFAKTPEDKDRAQQMLDALNRQAAAAAAPKLVPRANLSDSPSADADPDRPVLARRQVIEDPVEVRSAPARMPSVTGKFTEFLCGKPDQIVIDTGSEKKHFAIDDPGKIIITGRESYSIDLNCGPQKPAYSVELGFAPAPQGTKTDGAVRTLKFAQ